MGTRHLIVVQFDGEYKIAQYGQWDGYPEGQGMTVLDFLHAQQGDYVAFCDSLANMQFFTEGEESSILEHQYGITEEFISSNDERMLRFKRDYPQLNRDLGASILHWVASQDEPAKLRNSLSFAGDSLYCEWCYVIDIDAYTFEVYAGFNKIPITAGRFLSGDDQLENDGEYEPVIKVAEWSLNSLPDKDEFLETLSEKEE